MRKFLLALSVLAISATSAGAGQLMTGPVCYPDNGPAPGTLKYKARLVVSSSNCPSGRLVLIGGLNNGSVIIKQRTCHCG